MRFLPKLFRRIIRRGRLTLTDGGAFRESYGEAGTGPEVTLRLVDPSYDWKIMLNPELRFAEAYMDGALAVNEGVIGDLSDLFYLNKRQFDMTRTQIAINGWSRRVRRWHQHNPVARARRNAAAHYDVGNETYKLFLDQDLQYSCAYFPTGDETLEQAQRLKKRHIAAKLRLEPGQRVLDIGSGWGGMALYLARIADVEVLGVTLSQEQLKLARERAEAAGMADRVRFELRDYREVTERFDRIVSVGMLEHVGARHLTEYFLNVRDRLAPDGVALIHSIVTKAPPGVTGPFIRKHIFPGGYSPAVSEVFGALEKSGLWPLDAEFWRMHYARTLRHWGERFAARRDEAKARHDERFCRMWELYLAAARGAFEFGPNSVLQLQLGRERDGAPYARDYLAEESARLAERESG